MKPEELAEVLRLHRLWLDGKDEGRRAYLSGADLSGAYLTETILAPRFSRFQWAKDNAVALRVLDHHTLGLFRRTASSQHMMPATAYEAGTLYVAPAFSRCAVTECHPGLYIAGNDWNMQGLDTVLVAAWIDELEGPLGNKARVPRFYVCTDEAAFNALDASALDVVDTDPAEWSCPPTSSPPR